MEPIEAFRPAIPATVVIPYYEAPEALKLTLAGLERQTYPLDLFDVVVVDDGSSPPLRLEAPPSLRVRVLHQPDRGFGAARARNLGARCASGHILVFLDCDMVPEADWLAFHARWHHVASDVLTLGFRKHVDVDGINAQAVLERPGTLSELFADRPAEAPQWIERRMSLTDYLTYDDDNIFRVVTSGNLGVSAAFFDAVGGFDESFDEWGAEDIEFGYRAYALGAVLTPDRGAQCWHQGPGARISDEERLSLTRMQGKLMHLIPYGRSSSKIAGRSFKVPRFVVSVTAGHIDEDKTLATVQQVLASRVHDLAVWVSEEPGSRLEWLHSHLDHDHRVHFGPQDGAAAAFPAARFHISVPAGGRVRTYTVERLRARLGRAAHARARLGSGHPVTITRSWALQRAIRSGAAVKDIGTVVEIETGEIEDPPRSPSTGARPVRPARPRKAGRLRRYAAAALKRLSEVRTPRDAWRFVSWLAAAVLRRLKKASQRSGPAGAEMSGLAQYPLGAEIAVVGERAAALFAVSARIGPPTDERHIDLHVVDTSKTRRLLVGSNEGAPGRIAVLAELPLRFAVPAFDPTAVNPMDWKPEHESSAARLDSRWMPTTAEPPDSAMIGELRRLHHIEDSGAVAADPARRAGVLAALAAAGVLVRVTDHDPALQECLGADLYGLMAGTSIVAAGTHKREHLSIAMRRLALRDHSLRARARQLLAAHGLEAPLPEVSVLLATRRPELLAGAVEAVRAQTYPRVELVLALHGDGFGSDAEMASLAGPLEAGMQVVRVAAAEPLGAVLNAAVAASSGTLLTKFDDDDYYGADHLWDLVLAREYSGAVLVAKAAEYVYLSQIDQTIRVNKMREQYVPHPVVSGGVLLISRQDLDAAGGWRRVPRSVDISLARDVARVGGDIYWTHGEGYLRVRHGDEHTWTIGDDFFLDRSSDTRNGRDFDFAGF